MPNVLITNPQQNGAITRQNTVPPTAGPIEGTLDLERGATAITVLGGLFDLAFVPTAQIPGTTKPGTLKNNGRNFEFRALPIPTGIVRECQVVVWVRWKLGTAPNAPLKTDFASVKCRVE
jgi:hypothetical protein